MTTTAPPDGLTIADLIDMAAQRDVTAAALRRWGLAHASLGGQELSEAWEDLREAVRARDDLGTGAMGWQEYAPDLTCGERQQAAFEMACEAADEALRYLTEGSR